MGQRQLKEALQFAQQAVTQAESFVEAHEEGRNRRTLGSVYLATANDARGIAELEKALDLLGDDAYETAVTQTVLGTAVQDTKRASALIKQAQQSLARLGAKRELSIIRQYKQEGSF